MSRGIILNAGTRLVTETCFKCQSVFAIQEELYDKCQAHEENYFYCPNGHSQHYTKSENTKLKEQLAAEKEKRAIEERARRAAEEDTMIARQAEERAKKKLKRTQHRVVNGKCPCCDRHFANLSRHMKTKHPEAVKEHNTA